jgi:hypothetical protein
VGIVGLERCSYQTHLGIKSKVGARSKFSPCIKIGQDTYRYPRFLHVPWQRRQSSSHRPYEADLPTAVFIAKQATRDGCAA